MLVCIDALKLKIMTKPKLTFIYFIVFLALLSCNKKPSTPYKTITLGNVQETIKIEIDKKKSIKNFDSIFKKQAIIKLDSKKASLVSKIAKIVNRNNKIYIFDWYTDKSVICFDAKGNFKFKLKNLGKGPHEYFNYSYADINQFTGDIEILANGGGHLMIYDSLGNFKEKFKLPYSSNSFCSLKEKRYFYKGYIENKDEDFNFRLYSMDYNCEAIINRYLPYKVSKDPKAISSNIYGFSMFRKGEYRFIEAFNDTIYKVNNHSFKPLYSLYFDGYKDNKPDDFLYNNQKYGSRRDWAKKLKIPHLRSFHEFDNYIIGSYISNLEKSSYIKNFLYNKETKETLYNGYGLSFSKEIEINVSQIFPTLNFYDLPISHIEPHRIESIIKNMAIDLLYPNTQEKIRDCLKAYFEFDGKVTANPYIITFKLE